MDLAAVVAVDLAAVVAVGRPEVSADHILVAVDLAVPHRLHHPEALPVLLSVRGLPETTLPRKAIRAASCPTAELALSDQVIHLMLQDLLTHITWQETDFTLPGSIVLVVDLPTNLLLRPRLIQVLSIWTNAALSLLVILDTTIKDSASFLEVVCFAMAMVLSNWGLPIIV